VLPNRIVNKTNGITPRRWLINANPGLTDLLRETVGAGVVDDIERIGDFERYVEDSCAQDRFAAIKRANKDRLAEYIAEQTGVRIDPAAAFDVHVKRIHEYKRQLLNILETVALYDEIRANPDRDWTPRVKLFAGKAAASYVQAKSIIRLINDVAKRVNSDPAVRNLLKVVFMPNFNVSLAELIVPAADISEQISTAGMEASGTGNMKFALNGALTIGTLDGANVEIREHVGPENIVIFGKTAQEVEDIRRRGHRPGDVIASSPALRRALDAIASGAFSPDDHGRYAGLCDALWNSDYFLVTSDFDSYCAAQRRMDDLWRDRASWRRMTMLNTARMGWFSSDRTIREYAEEVWKVPHSRTHG
jgi:glycogen phosphorylase